MKNDIGHPLRDVEWRDVPASGKPFSPNSYMDKPRNIPPSYSKLLQSFIDPMEARIEGMSDRELNKLLVAFHSVSPINCSWQQFAIAKILFYYVDAKAMEASGQGPTGLDAKHDSAVAESHLPETQEDQAND